MFFIYKNKIFMDELKEEWKDVIGYEDLYQISNFGRIKSIKYEYDKILKTNLTNSGYLELTLHKNKKLKHKTIHRLVAIHFVDNPENKKEVNHKDGNKLNNYAYNLEWNTPLENTKHSIETGLCKKNGEYNPMNKLTETEVMEIKNKYKTKKYTQENLANEYNISRTNISLIINNKRWKHLI